MSAELIPKYPDGTIPACKLTNGQLAVIASHDDGPLNVYDIGALVQMDSKVLKVIGGSNGYQWGNLDDREDLRVRVLEDGEYTLVIRNNQ